MNEPAQPTSDSAGRRTQAAISTASHPQRKPVDIDTLVDRPLLARVTHAVRLEPAVRTVSVATLEEIENAMHAAHPPHAKRPPSPTT